VKYQPCSGEIGGGEKLLAAAGIAAAKSAKAKLAVEMSANVAISNGENNHRRRNIVRRIEAGNDGA